MKYVCTLSIQLKNYHYHCTIDVGIIRIVWDRTNKLVLATHCTRLLFKKKSSCMHKCTRTRTINVYVRLFVVREHLHLALLEFVNVHTYICVCTYPMDQILCQFSEVFVTYSCRKKLAPITKCPYVRSTVLPDIKSP